jgi:hypothetical protein
MTQRALSRSATAIAPAADFVSSGIFPLDRDPDWSKLTTIENESRALRLAAPSREEHICHAVGPLSRCWPPKFFGQQEKKNAPNKAAEHHESAAKSSTRGNPAKSGRVSD